MIYQEKLNVSDNFETLINVISEARGIDGYPYLHYPMSDKGVFVNGVIYHRNRKVNKLYYQFTTEVKTGEKRYTIGLSVLEMTEY